MDRDDFNIRVVTPAGTTLDETVAFVKFHAEGGELGVGPNHSATLAKIKPGELILTSASGQKTVYFITDGMAEVLPDKLTLLIPFLEQAKEINLDRAKKALKRANERLENISEDTDVARAKAALSRAKARIALHELLEKISK